MNKLNSNKKYDLEERTALLGEKVISLCKTINIDVVNKSLVSQLVRSSTSVGANYMEAKSGSSKRDFRHKIYICKKEVEETKHWLRMLTQSTPDKAEECRILWQEAQELTLIFGKIISSLNKSKLITNSELKIKN